MVATADMDVQQIDGQWFIVQLSKKGKKLSEAHECRDDAEDELTEWRDDEAYERETFGYPEDTPCLQPEQFMSYHS